MELKRFKRNVRYILNNNKKVILYYIEYSKTYNTAIFIIIKKKNDEIKKIKYFLNDYDNTDYLSLDTNKKKKINKNEKKKIIKEILNCSVIYKLNEKIDDGLKIDTSSLDGKENNCVLFYVEEK